jgi:hypothetical protein
MTERKRRSMSWSACKEAIAGWPAPGLVDLIRELYALNPENRRFLHSRLRPEAAKENLDQAIGVVKTILNCAGEPGGRFSQAAIKRVVDQFAKASGNPAAVADLLIADLEIALPIFSAVGDYEPLVDNIYSTMRRLDKLLSSLPIEIAGAFVPRISRLALTWNNKFGYGISDELGEFAREWQARTGK